MYNLEEEAIHYVFISFKGKKRMKEDIDKVFHSIMVGIMLKNIGCNEKICLSGYLHDIIEDTEGTYEVLKEKFGLRIADNVKILSENKEIKDWKERKVEFINRIIKENNDILLIELADKLQNLISDYNLFLKLGKECLKTESNSYENVKWFYLRLKDIFNERLENNQLLERYNQICNIYFE